MPPTRGEDAGAITRRQGLALGLGLAVAACGGGGGGGDPGPPTGGGAASTPIPTPTPTPSATANAQGVGQAAAARGMRFGSTFAYSAADADAGSFANPSYAALLERDCTILVPENELKWAAIRPSATTFDFTRADAMLAYAQAHGMVMRGHNLLWYDGRFDPGWLATYDFGSDPSAGAQALVRSHVQTVLRHYGTAIATYDVVNEAIDPATGTLRTNTLTKAVGGDTSLLDLAFQTARAEQPGAQLVYNDYMDWGASDTHRNGVLALLKGFRDRGVPVDALGVQSHLGFYSTAPVSSILAQRQPVLRAFLDAVTAMGYRLVVTELDVNDYDRAGDVATRDADVAALANGWLDVLFSYRQLRDVLVWGMSDRYSWLQSSYKRSDGLPLRPDPYDASFAPKPLRQTVVNQFAAAMPR